MRTDAEKIFVDYDGYIIIKGKKTIGLSTKKFGRYDDVEIWLPLSLVGHVTYANRETGDQTLIFVNQQIEAIEIPLWLAKDRGLAPVNK